MNECSNHDTLALSQPQRKARFLAQRAALSRLDAVFSNFHQAWDFERHQRPPLRMSLFISLSVGKSVWFPLRPKKDFSGLFEIHFNTKGYQTGVADTPWAIG